MPGQEANEVREVLEFDPATAGGMMNTDFVFVGDKSTRDEVLEWMKEQGLNLDQLDTIVLLDGGAQFSGLVPVARLQMAEAEQPLNELEKWAPMRVQPE